MTHARLQAAVDAYAAAPPCSPGQSGTDACVYDGPFPVAGVYYGGSGNQRYRVDFRYSNGVYPSYLTGPAAETLWRQLAAGDTPVVSLFQGRIMSVWTESEVATTTETPAPQSSQGFATAVALTAAGSAVLVVGLPLALRRRRWRGATVSGIRFETDRRSEPARVLQQLLSVAILWVLAGCAAALAVVDHSVLEGVSAVVLLEVGLAAARIASVSGRVVVDEELAQRVGALLPELCAAAGCAIPTVALRDDAVRVAAVRPGRDVPMLVLSRPYALRVADGELRALIAHEIAHLVHHDLRAARWRGPVAALTGLALAIGAVRFADTNLLGGAPIWAAAYTVGALAGLAAVSPLNRWRELRADRDGALLAGDPNALIRALQSANVISAEMRATVYGRPPLRWILSPMSWRLPSHPPLAVRVARLRSLAQGTLT